MQFLVTVQRRVIDGAADGREQEGEWVKSSYKDGFLRQIWQRGGLPGRVLLVEAENEQQARERLQEVPALEVTELLPLHAAIDLGEDMENAIESLGSDSGELRSEIDQKWCVIFSGILSLAANTLFIMYRGDRIFYFDNIYHQFGFVSFVVFSSMVILVFAVDRKYILEKMETKEILLLLGKMALAVTIAGMLTADIVKAMGSVAFWGAAAVVLILRKKVW